MNSSTDTSVSSPRTVRLPASSTVRECGALKQQLLGLLEVADAVQIDVTDVEIIDTAALQVLFAFSRERIVTGLRIVWRGESAAFRNAISGLGLQVGDSAGASQS